MQLNDKVTLVKSGASGLGEATVRNLIAHGTKIVILDLNMDRGKSIVNELSKDSVIFDKTDVTS